jgi:hypothetical protein
LERHGAYFRFPPATIVITSTPATQLSTKSNPNFADKFQSSFKAFVGWIGDLAFDANAWIAAATVLLFFATVLLTIIAWQQNKTTKPQLRAYVSVWPRWISSFNDKYFAEFTLTNVGALLPHIEFAITT